MEKLSIAEMRRKTVEEYRNAEKTPLIIVLDNVRSLHNIGAIFRTADAFLIECIYLCGITATPPHRDIHKTALGATESVAWKYVERTKDAILSLKRKNYAVFAVEQTKGSVFLNEFNPVGSIALVFGNEVKGVEQEALDLCDGCIEIPQWGAKHSLNIAVSVGIVVWDIVKKYRTKEPRTGKESFTQEK